MNVTTEGLKETARKAASRHRREEERRRWLARLERENKLPWAPDVCWFAERPDRAWRLRPASAREVFIHARMTNPRQPLPPLGPGCRWMKLIRNLGQDLVSSWATIPLCGVNATDDDVDDGAVQALYESLYPRRRRKPACVECDAEAGQ